MNGVCVCVVGGWMGSLWIMGRLWLVGTDGMNGGWYECWLVYQTEPYK